MKKPLTIFVVHPSDMLTDHLPNGEAWIAFNFLKRLADRGHTIHAAVPRIEMRDPLPPRLHLYQTAKRSGALGRVLYMWSVRNLLRRLMRTVRFDVAQQFTPGETGLSLGIVGLGLPLILGPLPGYWPDDSFGMRRKSGAWSRMKRLVRDGAARLQQRQARSLIVTCPAAIDRVISRRARQLRTHVVGPGIDAGSYPERLAIPERPSILFLANLEYWKGIFTLLEAFELVAAAVPECTLEIWGDGSVASEVSRRIQRSSFGQRIHCRGRAGRGEVAEIMRAHSVYCMPSYGEPFGMTLLEAMACGAPIVTTRAGGPLHIVDERGGRIVPVRDVQRLAAALIEVLSSINLQRAMGTFNRQRVEQMFDWERSLDRMEGVYEEALGVGSSMATRWRPRISA